MLYRATADERKKKKESGKVTRFVAENQRRKALWVGALCDMKGLLLCYGQSGTATGPASLRVRS